VNLLSSLDIDTFAKLLAPILSAIAAFLVKRYAESRSRVVSFIGHVSAFTLQDENRTVIHTHSVVVRNTGHKPAHNLRLSHAVLPQNVTVYPPVNYSVQTNPEGASDIVFPILVPKEQVTISYLYFPPLVWSQINTSAKSDDGLAKIINVIPMPQANRFIRVLVWILMLVGASYLFYQLVRFSAKFIGLSG
jgi:hypothetical protein